MVSRPYAYATGPRAAPVATARPTYESTPQYAHVSTKPSFITSRPRHTPHYRTRMPCLTPRPRTASASRAFPRVQLHWWPYLPPPTPPSTSIPRLNAGENTFVPRQKVTFKKEDRKEVNLDNIAKSSPVTAAPGTSATPTVVYRQGSPGTPNRRPASIRIESEDQRKARLAEEEAKEKERRRVKAAAEEKVRKEKEAAERKVREAEEKKRAEEEAEKERVRKAEGPKLRLHVLSLRKSVCARRRRSSRRRRHARRRSARLRRLKISRLSLRLRRRPRRRKKSIWRRSALRRRRPPRKNASPRKPRLNDSVLSRKKPQRRPLQRFLSPLNH